MNTILQETIQRVYGQTGTEPASQAEIERQAGRMSPQAVLALREIEESKRTEVQQAILDYLDNKVQ